MLNFQLKDKNAQTPTPVNAILTGLFKEKNSRIKISVGCKITPIQFGDKNDGYKFDRNILYKSKTTEALKFRLLLDKFEKAVQETEYHFLARNTKPNTDEFKSLLNTKLGRVTTLIKVKPETFESFVRMFCNECRDLYKKGRSTTKEVSIQKYEIAMRHFLNYQEFKEKVYAINDISYEVFQEFVETINLIAIGDIKLKINHLKKGGKGPNNAKGYCLTSLKNIVSSFKFLLKQSRVYGFKLHETLQLDDKRLSISVAKSSKDFYLSEDLLLRIYNHTPKKKTTQNAKDYIMIAATTGMRFQSVALLHEFQPQQIGGPCGESFIAVKNIATKTGIELLSPLMQPAQEVYERLGCFPTFATLSNVNLNIRLLFKEMGIIHDIELNESIYIAGVQTSKKRIDEVMTTHVCRASFITCLLLAGVQRSSVQAMTHKAFDESSSFSKYDKSSTSDRAVAFYNATKDLGSEFFKYKKGT